jgi:hypothetical protein
MLFDDELVKEPKPPSKENKTTKRVLTKPVTKREQQS